MVRRHVQDCAHLWAAAERLDLERRRGERDVLRADAQEPTHADHVGEDLRVLVEQDVADGTDFLVVRADYVGSFELGCQELIGSLLWDHLRLARRGLGARARGLRGGRFWRLRKGAARQEGGGSGGDQKSLEHVGLLYLQCAIRCSHDEASGMQGRMA